MEVQYKGNIFWWSTLIHEWYYSSMEDILYFTAMTTIEICFYDDKNMPLKGFLSKE